jgi:hypothetical protein
VSATSGPAASTEKYRHARAACGRELGDAIEQLSDHIDDPVVKLRFLRNALDQDGVDERRVSRLPFAAVRRAVYRYRGLEALQPVVVDQAAYAEVQRMTRVARRRARLLVGGVLATGLLAMPALLASVVLSVDRSRDESTPKRMATPAAVGQIQREIHPSRPLPPTAESLPPDVSGLTPSAIWLADQGPGWEVYSNGLRIETAFSVVGEPRRYRVHDRTKGLQASFHTRPVGILFHTSESDLWPMEADYGARLRQSTAGLLRYVRRTQAYNYLVDRFGRVYRVVDDETRATHAGHAIWARGDDVYLDLNNAFLGVSFESRWEGGHALPITQAQLVAGRNLTNYLRQRFAIAPDMCVTHGLASVSPRRHLIGYHLDWARGFPFAAFGLPDLYAQPPPSVTLFGFDYDQNFARTVGELWPGLVAAQNSIAAEARARAISIDALRRERQAVYDRWLKQIQDERLAQSSAPHSLANKAANK